MKYLKEYRDKEIIEKLLNEIKNTVTRPWNIMEICGGQTHSLVKNGIIHMLPEEIRMIHGPGCPVCVTPQSLIDDAIKLSENENIILCSFGDMLRVPGSEKNLLEAKATGGDIRIVYSPLEAVKLAGEHPDKEVVFFAVGFETTAPANALSVVQAKKSGIDNYSILASHVLVPPAMEAILDDPEHVIDGFLAAGHVCTIMGVEEYRPIVEKYKVPIVVTGFEPVDLLQGILMAVRQLEEGRFEVENQYARMVQRKGNELAQQTIHEVFDITDRSWRGIGEIPSSGYTVSEAYKQYDAQLKFNLVKRHIPENPDCIAGMVLRGLKNPIECPNFGKSCTPEKPLGAPMVSSEGACAAYYYFSQVDE